MWLAFAFLAAVVITKIDFLTAHKDSLNANLKVLLKMRLTRCGGVALFDYVQFCFFIPYAYVFMRYRYGKTMDPPSFLRDGAKNAPTPCRASKSAISM